MCYIIEVFVLEEHTRSKKKYTREDNEDDTKPLIVEDDSDDSKHLNKQLKYLVILQIFIFFHQNINKMMNNIKLLKNYLCNFIEIR